MFNFLNLTKNYVADPTAILDGDLNSILLNPSEKNGQSNSVLILDWEEPSKLMENGFGPKLMTYGGEDLILIIQQYSQFNKTLKKETML